MADVQLEHGFLKIANRLMEAIIEARFSEKQKTVLLVLLRLTYGWRKRSVRLTEIQLADYAGTIANGDIRRAGGAFRTELYELLKERVIVRIATEERGLFVWAINKNFSAWGRFSQAPARLEARWNPRPDSLSTDDHAVLEELARNQATSPAPRGPESGQMPSTEWPESGPPNAEKWPSDGPVSGPVPGHSVAPHQATKTKNPVDSKRVRPSERQGNTEKDRKAESHARGRAREGPAACSLSLAELRKTVYATPTIADFFAAFYDRASEERQTDVAQQLATLATGGSVEDANGHFAKAYSLERLVRKCHEILAGSPPRDPDKAILILLKKLGDTSDAPTDFLERERAAIAAEEREGVERAKRADAWAAEHVDEAAAIRREIEEQFPGHPPSGFTITARRMAFVARVARLAERAESAA